MNDPRIKSLSDVEHMRSRPGMYIGGCNNFGLNLLWADVISDQLDNPESHVSAGCLRIEVDGSLSLEIHGRVKEIVPADEYIPLCGPGKKFIEAIAITSAFSERLELEVVEQQPGWSQHFEKGWAVAPPEPLPEEGSPGMRLRFLPDRTLFPSHCAVDFHAACYRMQELAIFHPAATLSVTEVPTGYRRDYHYAHGLRSYMKELEYDAMVNAPVSQWRTPLSLYSLELNEGGDCAEVVILNRGVGPRVLHAWVNQLRCMEGTHIAGLERGIAEVASQFPPFTETYGPMKYEDPLAGKTVLLSLRQRQPDYCYSTKHCLANPAAESMVYRMVAGQLPARLSAERLS